VTSRRVVDFDTPGSSTNNTDRHDIIEILLQMALHTVNQTSSEIVVFLSHTYLLMLSTEIHHIANYLHNKLKIWEGNVI